MGALALVLLPDTGSVGPSLKWLIRQQQYGRTLAARRLVCSSGEADMEEEIGGGALWAANDSLADPTSDARLFQTASSSSCVWRQTMASIHGDG